MNVHLYVPTDDVEWKSPKHVAENKILTVCLSIYGSLALVDRVRLFSFLIHAQSVGLFGRGISPSQGRFLQIEQYKQNKRTQISIPRMGFEPMIPVFEWP
jgi:hypothetical protein